MNRSSMPFNRRDDFGEFIQQATAVELPHIMGDSLDAKYAFAF